MTITARNISPNYFDDLNDETKDIIESNYKLENTEDESYTDFNSLKKAILD